MDHKVRPATVTDAAGIATVHVASWQTAYRGLLADDLLDNLSVANRREQWSAILTQSTPRAETLVTTHADGVAGFASFGPRRCDNPSDGDGELYAIYLHPGHWSQGIGYQLHNTAIRRLRELGFTTATLWVLAGNERAINFYRRTGWQDTGTTRIDNCLDGTERPELQLHHHLRATNP